MTAASHSSAFWSYATEPAIQTRALYVRFGRFTLGPIDLTIPRGRRVALLGANGAGKSTLLNVLAGRLLGYTGSAIAFGDEVAADPVATRRRVGFLPEKVVAYDWMTVADYFALHRRFFPTWDPFLATELSRRLKLDAGASMRSLSRGTRVKVAFVTAESVRPPLLLLDEPTSGIDPVVRDAVIGAMREQMDADSHRTLIFSTHILEDVADIADHVIVIAGGRIAVDSPIGDIPGNGDAVLKLREVIRHASS